MTENKAFEEYTTVVKDMTTASPALPRQPVSVSALVLYHHAAAAMEEFREVTEAFVTTVRESFPNVGFNLAPLKSLGRICEKSVLKHRGGVDKVRWGLDLFSPHCRNFPAKINVDKNCEDRLDAKIG